MKYFDEHKSEFGQTEERRASHILLSAPASASDAERQAARARAEQLVNQARKAPQSFAALAQQYSQDPGSAANGGDLGYFGRNMMVKAFEDAVFQMKPDEISDIVETDFGFHIIKLTAIKDPKPVSFNEVKGQVEQQIKNEKAAKLFGEVADGFGNLVYEQSDSLQPAAEKFGLPVKRSGWIGRDSGEPPYLNNGRLLQAIFSEDALKNKRNTEAVEVAPNTLVAAKVLDHRPARMPSIAELRDRISSLIVQKEARALAVKEGREKLAQLHAGQRADISWGAEQRVSRKDPQGVDNETLRAAFKTDATALPSYTGVENPEGGFTLVRVSRVIQPEMPDVATRRAFAKQLQQLLTQEELTSYLAGVRTRYDVSVKSVN
jgi:peptidyl-prolyl cis-trans isomerase D